jgi:hypothetical protein
MRLRHRRRPALPLLMFELAVASAETIARRTALMASGRCTPVEYTRMVAEKMIAARRSGRAAVRRAGVAALLAPWHIAARRNARRLRRR